MEVLGVNQEMSFREEVEKLDCKVIYIHLLEQIIGELDELNELERLVSICRGKITEERRASIHDVRSLFRELENNGSLKINNYEILKEILIQTEKRDLLEKVEELERQLQHSYEVALIISRTGGIRMSIEYLFLQMFSYPFYLFEYVITFLFQNYLENVIGFFIYFRRYRGGF